ncbi:MAG: LysE family transporter, partial [Okeania sp. SIO4D6]|nr:LysE family transporter [Okeania sp. SIO4D6]
MITKLLLSGMFIGFFIALPFGGNAVLCTKNTLSYGSKYGLATGLGAATAHTTYSFIGFSGLVAVKSLLSNYLGILEIIGGLFLCYFGVSSIRHEKRIRRAGERIEQDDPGKGDRDDRSHVRKQVKPPK